MRKERRKKMRRKKLAGSQITNNKCNKFRENILLARSLENRIE